MLVLYTFTYMLLNESHSVVNTYLYGVLTFQVASYYNTRQTFRNPQSDSVRLKIFCQGSTTRCEYSTLHASHLQMNLYLTGVRPGLQFSSCSAWTQLRVYRVCVSFD